jgi:glycosyltransferase involved in cell wall biosynthesis
MTELSLGGRKIVFLFGSFDLGGAEQQGLLLADHLHATCGADVKVLALDPRPGRLSHLCDQRGIPWKGIPFHWGLSRRWYYLPQAIAALRTEKADVLISSTCVPNLVSAIGRQLVNAKLSVWRQEDEGLLMNRLPLHRWAVRQPHCFISNSSGGRRFLVDTYGIPEQKVHLIRNGITLSAPLQQRDQWRAELGLPDNAPVACMVANLSRYKDHETLLRAWQLVTETRCGASPVLLLAGRFDDAAQRLRALAAELHLADSIRLLGPVADVSGLLHAVDLFAYSSRSEGIPNAVLEAMAAGLPVVGTAIPGILEAVGAEGAAFLAPVGNHAAMAEKICLLLENAPLRNEYGSILRQRAASLFSQEQMFSASCQLIARALAAMETPR